MKVFKNDKLVYVIINGIKYLISSNKPTTPPENIPVEAITISPSNSSIEVGQTLQLTAMVLPANATDNRVAWSSGDTTILSVTQTGIVTALKEGTSYIYCASVENEQIITSCNVAVISQEIPEPEPTGNELEVPTITTYYWNPKPFHDEEVIIPIYITDYYQREYYYEDNTLLFDLRVEVDGEVKTITNLKGGDHNINLTQMFPAKMIEGEHCFSFQVTDKQGRKSYRLFNEIWIVNRQTYPITPAQTYTITDADLTRHSVNKNNSQVAQDMTNNRVGLTNLFAEIKTNGYRKCVLPKGTYRINRCIRDKVTGQETDDMLPIRIPSGFTIDFNEREAIIKLHPYSDIEYGKIGDVANLMISMKNCVDSHLINFNFEGDTSERQANGWLNNDPVTGLANGEGNNCFSYYGGKYSSVDSGKMTQITGYSHITGAYGGKSSVLSGWTNNTDVINGIDTIKELKTTCNYTDITNYKSVDGFICISIYLAMGGRVGQTYWLDIHFYDENKAFIETIRSIQYRYCKIPINSKFIRVTYNGNSSQSAGLAVHNAPFPRNCSVVNMDAIDNRTCMAPSSFSSLLYKNINFTRSGWGITPCCIDLEDGWERHVDFYMYDCNVLEQSGTMDLIDNAGLNHVIKNCNNFRMSFGGRNVGVTVDTCSGSSITDSIAPECGNTKRFFNNTLIDISGANLWNATHKVKYKNNVISGFGGNLNLQAYCVENCDLILKSYAQTLTAYDCDVRTMDGAYLLYSMYFEKCRFNNLLPTTTMTLCFNQLNTMRSFKDCVFNVETILNNKNAFNTGLFENCTFKEDVRIQLNLFPNTNKLGDIKFNNCRFEKRLIANLVNTQYVEFNNCTFVGDKVLQGSAITNCIFNTSESNKAVTGIFTTISSFTLTSATKTKQLGTWITPIDASNKNITWRSSNTNVATVDAKGLVTRVGVGSCEIIATTEYGGFEGKCNITVNS